MKAKSKPKSTDANDDSRTLGAKYFAAAYIAHQQGVKPDYAYNQYVKDIKPGDLWYFLFDLATKLNVEELQVFLDGARL